MVFTPETAQSTRDSPRATIRSLDTWRVTQGLTGVGKYMKVKTGGEGNLLSSLPALDCVQILSHPLNLAKAPLEAR